VQDFGFVGAAETLSRAFPLRNAGDTAVQFAWSVAPPYTIEPASGTLAPGESASITATFAPLRAAVYDIEARAETRAQRAPARDQHTRARSRISHTALKHAKLTLFLLSLFLSFSPARRCALWRQACRPCA
jgi:hypothetical protein